MKQFTTIFLSLFLLNGLLGQVGINTTAPNAMLDIRSSNQATPASTDGILLPVIDEFPAANPGANQDGMLVFVSGNGTAARGLYYWDNTGSSWIGLSNGWKLAGNSGTVAGTDFVGTTDSADLVFKTNNLERLRLTNIGQLEFNNTNGNTIIGEEAGGNVNPFNAFNTALGYRALRNLGFNANDNVALGGNALEACTSCTDNVGVGRASLFSLASASRNTAVGYFSLFANDNNSNTAVGWASGQNATGTGNIFLGHTAGYNETGSDRLYIENSSTATPLIGGDFANNRVGINRSIGALTNTLEVGGNASKTAAGAWLANSDRRLKTNINAIGGLSALDLISKMRGVSFEWNDHVTGIHRPEGKQIGFIAQELMEIFPEKVTKDRLGYYQTAYGDYDPIFVEAIKALALKLEQTEVELGTLKARLARLEALFEDQ